MAKRHTFLGLAYVASWRRPESCFEADRRALLGQYLRELEARLEEAVMLTRWALAMARGVDRYHGLHERSLECEVRELAQTEAPTTRPCTSPEQRCDMTVKGPFVDRCRSVAARPRGENR